MTALQSHNEQTHREPIWIKHFITDAIKCVTVALQGLEYSGWSSVVFGRFLTIFRSLRTFGLSLKTFGRLQVVFLSVSIQIKATDQYILVVLVLGMLYKVVLPVKSVDEILKCDHSNESYWAVLACGLFITLFKAVPSVCAWSPQVWPFKWKLLGSSFVWYCLLCFVRSL